LELEQSGYLRAVGHPKSSSVASGRLDMAVAQPALCTRPKERELPAEAALTMTVRWRGSLLATVSC
jgi:hypothetical protein